MSLGAAASVGDGGGNGGTGNGAGSGAGTGAGAGTGSGAGGNAGSGTGAANDGAGSGAGNQGDKGSLGTGNAGTTSWRDSLPDDLKADPTLSKYSDLPNLAKAHIELQKKFGQKGIFKPGKDASAEEIKSFREALGIPTDPTKYDMGEFDKNVKVDQAIVDWAKEQGAKRGIDPVELKGLITDYMGLDASNQTNQAAAKSTAVMEGLKSLKSEWGEGFDRNLSRANYAAEKLGESIGGKGVVVEALKKYGADNDPVLLKAFAEAAKLYGDDKLREAGAGDGRSTPAELDAQISEVQGRLLSLKPTDGAYQAVKQRYESLWKQKTGGK